MYSLASRRIVSKVFRAEKPAIRASSTSKPRSGKLARSSAICASYSTKATQTSVKRVIGSKIPLVRSTVARSYATVEPFKLADIGEGIAEVELIQWFVKEGDRVEEFDKICEVQSDKATVEIKAPKEGVISKLYHQVGDMAKVGQPLVDFTVDGAAASSAPATPAPAAPTKAAPSSPATPTATAPAASVVLENDILVDGKTIKILATPAVRHLAHQHKVNLATVRASGKDGRVTKGDLLDFISGKTAPRVVASTPSRTTPSAASTSTAVDRVEKLKGYNKAMAKKMTESLSIPHFGYCDEVYMDELIKLRKDLKPMAEKRGIKLSYMPFIIKACSLGLKKYPILNSSISPDLSEITYHGSHNIGIAVDTPTGLVVPNIKNVQDLSIFEIAQELNRLIDLAKVNKLLTQDLSGGTFSLSNIGAIGGTYAKPVVVVPEVCIAAIGKMQTLPRFDANGAVYAANLVQFSWSADHRVIDGASMANFSNLVKLYLEKPASMLMDTK